MRRSVDEHVGIEFGGAVGVVYFDWAVLVGPILEALGMIPHQSKDWLSDQVNTTKKGAQHSSDVSAVRS